MESFAKPLSFFFLLVLFSSLPIQAREGRFFSKVARHSTNNNIVTEPKIPLGEAPTPAPAPDAAEAPTPVVAPTPAPTHSASQNGYGLYGHGSGQFSPTEETQNTATKFEDEILTGELKGESFETGYPKTNLYNQNGNTNNGYTTKYNSKGYASNYNSDGYVNNYNANGYSNNYDGNGYSNNYVNGNGFSNTYNSNGYQSERQGMSDTRFLENGRYYVDVKNENHNLNKQGMSDTRFLENGRYYVDVKNENHNLNKQGMSDTRFLENGRYYVDVKNENNNLNGYESGRGTSNNEGYYGNNLYANEFNSMEEYEKQEESQEDQFVP
ncbi:Protein E6 [Morella rubra]|uniref:Protein E6 n=1 Tax=Morella rubra TaxID=262757 RepID=A0A6A1UJK6_9ROSI|nr:Protein E6 [Morella rubra]